ncbi:MAG: Do family serine endopeptidase [Caldithrix sp.]|nr:MAG: Do family serine endopeptidase [Caldithrix sp.]
MNKGAKRTTLIVFSVVVGIMVGLVVASNFGLTRNGFADSVTSEQVSSVVEPLPQVNSDLEATSRAFVAIAKRVIPTVVAITSEKTVKVRDPFSNFFHNDDFFRRFFRQPRGEQEYKQRGLGSGVIVSPDGYIMTNYHVIKDADEINVRIDRKAFKAEVVGTDPATDLAIVKIDEKNLPAILFGDSDKLEVGELVLAVGSPFDLRLQHTVTSGIISAKGRTLNLSGELTYQDFIQTDAAINPGNSGGALVNIHGELIGINTAIYAGNTGGNVGIGFAVPINLAKHVMDDLIEHGEVVRGYLGVFISTLDEELGEALKIGDNEGAVVTQVVEGTPADKAGLKKYDVIREVDGRKITDSQALTNLVASYRPGDKIDLNVVRDGKEKMIRVELQKRPNSATNSRPALPQDDDVLSKLGLHVSNLTDELASKYGYEEEQGIIVHDVGENSVAAEKGMRVGDLIIEIDRQKVRSVREFEKIVDDFEAGQVVLFQVKRGRSSHFIAMKVPK